MAKPTYTAATQLAIAANTEQTTVGDVTRPPINDDFATTKAKSPVAVPCHEASERGMAISKPFTHTAVVGLMAPTVIDSSRVSPILEKPELHPISKLT